MIWRMKDSECVKKENLHGGQGAFCGRYPLLRGDAPEGSAFRMAGRLTLDPGTVIGRHTHTGDEEIYVVLAGRAIYWDDDVRTEVGPGDVMFTWKGHAHGIENPGPDPLEFFAVIAD